MGSIIVTNLGKAYKQYPSKWSRLMEWISPGSHKFHSLIWILEDISFSVESGEAVGIIGVNGAGKSTLLKMICGTTRPTNGSVELKGRIAALLELGMGFHPEFTGRQNALMASQLLGIEKKEIQALMPEIEAFAEIGDYIDQPIRVYSSGMQVRLAFSVATAIRPDILIIDEALSVGDAYFQHKSFERIRKYRKEGTTLLIVSHDKQAIQSICDKAVLLNNGKVELEGKPEAVMDYYNALLADHQDQYITQIENGHGDVQTISGTEEANVKDIALYDENGKKVECLNVGQRVNLRVVVEVRQYLEKLVLGYGIKDRLGQVIYGTNTSFKNQILNDLQGGQEVVFNCRFDANIGPGSYSVQTALVSGDTHLENNYEWRDLALLFNVVNSSKVEFTGVAWIEPEIGIELL